MPGENPHYAQWAKRSASLRKVSSRRGASSSLFTVSPTRRAGSGRHCLTRPARAMRVVLPRIGLHRCTNDRRPAPTDTIPISDSTWAQWRIPARRRIRSRRVLPNRHSGSHLKFCPTRVQADHPVSGRIEHAVGRIWVCGAWRREGAGKAWLAHIPPSNPRD